MVRRNLGVVIALLFTAVAVSGTARAASEFTEDFSSNTLGPNLSVSGTALGAPAPDTTGGDVLLAGVADPGRVYVGTNDTDFNTFNFTAQVNVEILTGGGANAFFGMGVGTPAGDGLGQAGNYGEPGLGPVAYITMNSDNRDGGGVNIGDLADGESVHTGTGNDFDPNIAIGPGIHTLILEHDVLNGTVTFSFIEDIATLDTVVDVEAATITQSGSFVSGDNGFDSTGTRIFFGGDDSTRFDNFQISNLEAPGAVCDINENGACNSTDFEILRDNLFTEGNFNAGDLDASGFVDFADYRIFKDHPLRVTGFDGALSASIAVPEPASVGLFACALLGACVARRSRQLAC